MSTLHLVHPQLREFLTTYQSPTMDAEHLALLRNNPRPFPTPAETLNLELSEHLVPGPPEAPPVRVLVYRPTTTQGAAPAIFHVHGGGYIVGAPEMSDADNRAQSTSLGCVIVSVDYRLPPETPFPGPLEDCYAALKWLHGHAAELGVDPARIAVKGESAGGGLAAGLALLARDRGEIPVAFQCLTYPMIDDRPASDPHPFTGEFVWNAQSNRFGWSAYLGVEPGGTDVSPYAAAARAPDLSGLPPTLIITAALDLFLEENLDFARRLTRAGVPVELLVYPGAYHGFQMAGETDLKRRYMEDCGRALAKALFVD